MAKELFRLVRFLGDDWENCDYLVSCENDSFQFSRTAQEAKLFDTWEDFVAAARAVWLDSGPVDIMFERVYTITRRPVQYA